MLVSQHSLLGLYAPVLAAPIHRCLGIEATIVGTNGPDVVKGTQGDDVIVGRDGDDRISGLSGDDTLCGGRGADVVHARSKQSFDKECGGGDYGDEALSGGKGNDRLFGGGYLIYMAGNRGNDLLGGCNRLDLSGVGFGSARGPVTVNLKKGFAKGDGYDTLRHINYVVGSTFGDTIIGSNYPVKIIDTSYSELLVGGGGNDKVSGLQGPDEIYGGSGADNLLGADGVAGNDYLRGDDGTDTCTFDVSDTDSDTVDSCES